MTSIAPSSTTRRPEADTQTAAGYTKLRASQVGPAVSVPPRPRSCLCGHGPEGHFARGTGPCKTRGCVCAGYRAWRSG